MKLNLQEYLITDPLYYSNDILLFEKKLTQTFNKNKIDMACFRDKSSINFKELATLFVSICKKFEIKNIFINSNYTLAHELGATGVHLTSSDFDKIHEAKKLGLEIIISCHNNEDIIRAKQENVTLITFSPIFDTPNKGKAKGVEVLNEISNRHNDIHIFALGGIIRKEHVQKISHTKIYGFASIRYFI